MSASRSAPSTAVPAPGIPLYARVLGLRQLRPGGLLCFLLFEGTITLGALLGLAELANWWSVLVLPATVAIMVKVNDLVAGALTQVGGRDEEHTVPGRLVARDGRVTPGERLSGPASEMEHGAWHGGDPARAGRRAARPRAAPDRADQHPEWVPGDADRRTAWLGADEEWADRDLARAGRHLTWSDRPGESAGRRPAQRQPSTVEPSGAWMLVPDRSAETQWTTWVPADRQSSHPGGPGHGVEIPGRRQPGAGGDQVGPGRYPGDRGGAATPVHPAGAGRAGGRVYRAGASGPGAVREANRGGYPIGPGQPAHSGASTTRASRPLSSAEY